MNRKRCLLTKAAAALNISCDDITSFEIMKKAIDARRAKPPRFVYVLKITVSNHAILPFVVKDGISCQEMNVESVNSSNYTG